MTPPGLDGLRLDIVAADQGAAGCRSEQAGQQLDRRRLACAIGAQEGKKFPLLDVEVQIVDRRQAAVGFGKVFCPDHYFLGARSNVRSVVSRPSTPRPSVERMDRPMEVSTSRIPPFSSTQTFAQTLRLFSIVISIR